MISWNVLTLEGLNDKVENHSRDEKIEKKSLRGPAKQGQNQNNDIPEKMELMDRRKLFFKYIQK